MQIVRDDRYYPRITPSWFRIHEYREAMRTGAEFPPLLVAHDVDHYLILDGWHTKEADRGLGHKDIRCEVSSASRDKWLEIAVQRNAGHGHRMSVQDKARVIYLLRQQGYSWQRVSSILWMPSASAKRIVNGRVLPVTGTSARPVIVKGPLVPVASKFGPQQVEDMQAGMAAQDQMQLLAGTLVLFTNDAVDYTDEEVMEVAVRLAEAAGKWLLGVKKGAA